MKKITFYGKDFTPIADAKVKEHKLTDIIDGCDKLTYRGLLEQFVRKYKIPKTEDSLYFYADNTKFGRWVGVFRKKKFKEDTTQKEFDITLEISCRFDTDEKAFFLSAMLLSLDLKNLKFINPEVAITFHQVMDIFLLFMYKNQLANAAKKGIFRKYQRFENNDSRPHGTIDIARHIRENMGLESGRIAYNYRELTANNPVNRLILAAYKRLCEKFPMLCKTYMNHDESVYAALKTLQTELGYSKTNVRGIVKENLRPITHPYFSEYEILRKTCLKILRGENVSIFDAGSSEETDSLCVDVTRLWEQFLEVCLKRQLEDLGKDPENVALSLTTQGGKQGKEPTFAERKNKFSEPDFVLWEGEQKDPAYAILDAKFKPHWNEFFCGRTDTFIDADINKCIRDMVVFQARRTGVIFPFPEGENSYDPYYVHYQIGVSNKLFDMVRVPVPQQDGKTSFKGWCQELESAVKRALEKYLLEIQQSAKLTKPNSTLSI